MGLWNRLKDAVAREAQALVAGDHAQWNQAREEVEGLMAEIRSSAAIPPPDIALEDVLAPLKRAQKDSAARAARILLALRRTSAAPEPPPALFDGQA